MLKQNNAFNLPIAHSTNLFQLPTKRKITLFYLIDSICQNASAKKVGEEWLEAVGNGINTLALELLQVGEYELHAFSSIVLHIIFCAVIDLHQRKKNQRRKSLQFKR